MDTKPMDAILAAPLFLTDTKVFSLQADESCFEPSRGPIGGRWWVIEHASVAAERFVATGETEHAIAGLRIVVTPQSDRNDLIEVWKVSALIETCRDCGMTDGSCACAPAACPDCGALEHCDCALRNEPHCAGGCSECLGVRGMA